MFEKLGALFNLFRVGNAVASPHLWRTHQITVNSLAMVIMSLVGVCKAFGYTLPISDEMAISIAGGVLTLVNVVLTVIRSDKLGLPEKKHAPLPTSADPSAVDTIVAPAVADATGVCESRPDLHPDRQSGDEAEYAKRPGWPFGGNG